MSDWLDRPMPTSDSGAFKVLRVLAWVCLIGGGAIAASTRSGDPIVSPTGVVGWTAAVVAVIGGIGSITLPIYRRHSDQRTS